MVYLNEREKIIDWVEEDDNFFKSVGSNLAFEWEKYLVSDYWKNWRDQIRQAQSEEDAVFLANKTLKLRECVGWNIDAYKKGICDAERLKELTESKEKELKNITREEWEFIEEIGKEVDRFVKGGLSTKNYYRNWSKEELITEISRLKAEIKRLKTFKIDGDWGKEKVKEFSQKLEQHLTNSQICLDSLQKDTSNKKVIFSIIVIVGVISVISLLGFIVYKVHGQNS